MKRSHYVLSFFALILFVLASTASAQSSSRDNPTSLDSGDISGNMNDHGRESFYSFTAGPGEVTITLDVNARRDEQGVLNFDVLARNGATSLACCYFAQGDGGGTGREVATFKLAKRQTVILHTTNGPIGGGTFRIRITGATAFTGASGDGDYSNNDNNDRDRGNRGDSIDVPSSGILRIRMKNGTTQNIDLSRVRSISVRP